MRPYIRYIALMTAGSSALLVVLLGWIEPSTATLSVWQPSLLFGTGLLLRVDPILQPLGIILALVNCCAILVTLDRVEKSRPRFLAMIQLLLPAGLMALWSANVLTMLVAWALYDLLQALSYIVAIGSARWAIKSLVFGYLATLLLWIGTLISDRAPDSGLWTLMNPTIAQTTLWTLAGMIRLWMFPFHLAAPGEMTFDSPLAAPLFLGPVLGWGLWIRLMTISGVILPEWVQTLAALNIAVGGWLAWTCKSTRNILSWVGLTVNGAILLASCLVDQNGGMIAVAGAVSWMLGITVLLLGQSHRGKSPWWSVPSFISGLTLIGLPFTLGFVTTSVLADRLIGGELEIGAVKLWSAFFGSLFFTPALARWIWTSAGAPAAVSEAPVGPAEEVSSKDTEEDTEPDEDAPDSVLFSWLAAVFQRMPVPIIGRALGMGIPAALIVLGGIYPSLLVRDADPLWVLFQRPGGIGWILWGISLL
ncbi:MAG TPA: hypothetical protein ENN19_16100, partial [Chloroflexi bacterium]|nr:hypothetical protein [Chloroflexota bacterium]